MNEPPEVHVAEPMPPRSRRHISWGKIAEACGALGMILFLAWGFCFKMSRAEILATSVVLASLVLLCIHFVLPGWRYPGRYPPLAPHPAGSIWLVLPPSVSFWFVFLHALCALYYVGLGLVAATHDKGLEWGLSSIIAMAVVILGAALVLGRALRTRPELEVDEGRRELHWRPNAVWAKPVTLQFDAIVGVRVVTGRYFRYDPPEEFFQPEITWRSDTGRVRTTRLPISADRERVEEVATRLRAAVLGTQAESSATPDMDHT